MSEFSSLTRPDLADLIGARSGTTGFQGAHVHGRAWFNSALSWLDDLNTGLTPGSQKRIGPDRQSNGVLLPEQKKGSAILGVAAHLFEHVDEFNKLVYDPGDPNSSKFFNRFQLQLENALGLSPRVRGNHLSDTEGLIGRGSIPARAGEPSPG